MGRNIADWVDRAEKRFFGREVDIKVLKSLKCSGDSLLGTVNVTVAAAEVFPSTMTTDWVFVRAVAIVIQSTTS